MLTNELIQRCEEVLAQDEAPTGLQVGWILRRVIPTMKQQAATIAAKTDEAAHLHSLVDGASKSVAADQELHEKLIKDNARLTAANAKLMEQNQYMTAALFEVSQIADNEEYDAIRPTLDELANSMRKLAEGGER